MSYSSIQTMLLDAEAKNLPLDEVIVQSDLSESGLTKDETMRNMQRMWEIMQRTSAQYCAADRSNSGLAGGDAKKLEEAIGTDILYTDGYMAQVMAEALKTAECNACMKRIVAAPTAGSCGVIPAVLIPLRRMGRSSDSEICRALLVAAGIGQVIAARATLAGAEGGCQAEIGSASAMAAAALVFLRGGSHQKVAEAVAMALSNLEGLVCDPVAGYVEIPCIKRNVIGAMNAISTADMALAGLRSAIPADEVIDAMAQVGQMMNSALRETGIGGLAGTPTGQIIKENIQQAY